MRKHTAFRLTDEVLAILSEVGNRAAYICGEILFRHQRTVLALEKLECDGWTKDQILKVCKESAGTWRNIGSMDQALDTVVSEYWIGNEFVRKYLE